MSKAKNKKNKKNKIKKKVVARKPVAAKAKSKSAPKKVSRPLVKAKAKPVAKAKVQTKAAAKPVAKSGHKPSSTAKPALRPAQAKAPQAAAVRPAAAAQAQRQAPVAAPMAPAKPFLAAGPVVATPAPKKLSFKINELIVYPAHGVGKVVQIEEQEIAGAKLELYIVDFEKEKLRLKVPTGRAEQKGMRRLSDKFQIEQAMRVLKGRARIKRTMWSRRAQEYDAKINSGDLISVAEVVRDLYRSEKQPEQSYSERQLFEQALDRMAREIAAVKKIDDDMAVKELEDYLAKNAKRGPAAGEKTDGEVPSEEAA